MDKDSKRLLWLIGIIVGVFAVVFLAKFVYNTQTGAAVTIDDLHKNNLEGKTSDENYIYNGFSFVFMDNLWYTQIKRDDDVLLDVPLHFGPKDLKDVTVKGSINDDFQQSQVYITFDPTEENFKFVALSSAELSLNLAKGIEVLPIAACIKDETDACKGRPIVTCDDSDKAVIYLKKTKEKAQVALKGNCVELSGEDWELVKATDRFLLQWYQVMK